MYGLVCDGLDDGLVSEVDNGLNDELDSGPIGPDNSVSRYLQVSDCVKL